MTVDIAHSRTFASLSVRNYRFFWTGSFVSNVGTWMNRVAQDWLVLTVLTDHSSTALGLVTGLQFLPIALMSPLAGAFADRFQKRHMLMITQISLALNAAILAVLVSLGVSQLWHVFVLATMGGVIAAFDQPARQAFASEMVGSDLLTNAVGLNSASFNAARLIGPGLAGLIIAWVGIAPALWINAASFAAVIFALTAMDPSELEPAPQRRGRGAIREGFAYVRRRPDLQLILVMVFVLGTFGMNFQVTNALMATEVYGVGAEAYGLLGSVMAAGSLSAALIAARRERPRLRVLIGSMAGFALGTFLLASSPWYWLYAVLLIPVGLAALTVMTNANASVQLSTPAPLRGRVMALYMAIFQGGTPLGAPFIGWVGDVFGARATLYVGAVATGIAAVAAGTLLLWRYPSLRASVRRYGPHRRHPAVPAPFDTEEAPR
ncbi:MFS transporter [Propionicicella superfundia]|uniref:MFS transporter n=1 Tax=Propionicicella superfundia TaxID=348582 RepID=UPI0003FD854E|nr:MFS transporter [Propionicicella superfundia]